MERSLCSSLIPVDRQSFQVFRVPSDRKNCCYSVESFSVSPSSSKELREEKELEAAAQAIVVLIEQTSLKRKFSTSFKVIVYCLSQREALSLPSKIESLSSQKISAISVIGSLKPQINEQHRAWSIGQARNLELWRKNQIQVVCATSSFIEGQDQPDVRLVIFLEGAYDLISLVQGFGRVSRDGMSGDCVLLVRRDRTSPTLLTTHAYALSIECRRKFLAKEMDGLPTTPSCLERRDGCEICDNCRFGNDRPSLPTHRIGSLTFSERTQIITTRKRSVHMVHLKK